MYISEGSNSGNKLYEKTIFSSLPKGEKWSRFVWQKRDAKKDLYNARTKPSFSSLKGNSRLILTIFCIDVNIGWINFTAIIDIDDE